MKEVEVFSLGDELLRGIVADSNSGWIAKRVTARGAALRRVTTLPDEPAVVAVALREAMARAPALIVTQGGLGPTDDDRTREALARALGVPQQRHADAEAIIRRRFDELAAAGIVGDTAMNDARLRMADLPEGARALDNQVGTAPGIVCVSGPTTILSLPGVPPELAWIWENPAASVLDDVLGPGGFAEVTFGTGLRDESSIAWLLEMLQGRHPGVYVKSRAHGFDAGDEVRITLTAPGATDADARASVDAAAADLRAALAAEGIALDTAKGGLPTPEQEEGPTRRT